MADIKISELEPTTDLMGLYTIGSDKNNQSKKVSLQFLKDAADYAKEQGDYAKQEGETIESRITDLTAETNAKLDELSEEIGNVVSIKATNTETNKRLEEDGTYVDANNFRIHSFPVDGFTQIYVQLPSSATQSSPYSGFYDTSGNPLGAFIRSDRLREGKTLEVPSNATTYKVSLYNIDASAIIVEGESANAIIPRLDANIAAIAKVNEILGYTPITTDEQVKGYAVLSSGKISSVSSVNIRLVKVSKGDAVTTTYITAATGIAAGFTTEDLIGLSIADIASKGVVFDVYPNDYTRLISIVAPNDGWMIFNIDAESTTTIIPIDNVTRIVAEMGVLSALATEVKDTLVGAINEVYGVALPAKSVGDITKLQTQNKSSIVDAINEVKSSIIPSGGTAYVGKATQVILHESNDAELGAEILTNDGWILGDGWSGSFANGFTHTGSNNGSIKFPIPNLDTEIIYQLAISVTNTNTGGFDSYRVRLGGSELFATYQGGGDRTDIWALKASSEDNYLEILSTENAWSGSVTAISLKPITNTLSPFVEYRDKESVPSVSITSPMSAKGSVYIGSDNPCAFLAQENVGVGYQSLKDVLTGFWNVAVGSQALKSLKNGSRNVALGFISQLHNVSGHRNISIGSFSLEGLESGDNNIAIGADAQQDNISGKDNITIGTRAGVGVNGRDNIGIGSSTLAELGDNVENIAIGKNAMAKVAGTNKIQNVAIGVGAMGKTTGSIGNTIVGYAALPKVTGNYNTVVGYNAGSSVEYGIHNVIVGKNADHGKNKVNSIIIGANVKGVNDNEIRIGLTSHTSVILAGKVIHFNEDGSVTWTNE